MTTMLIGDNTKPPLVLVHGFGGAGALYYKVMKGLAENFYVIVIDLVGMGSSTRISWDCENGDQADEYFMSAIEKWRVNMNNLTGFYLAAHSYGAYLMGTYASRYPSHIRKLILLSPLGVKGIPENFELRNMRFRSGAGPPAWAVSIGRALWGKVTPFNLLKLMTAKSCKKRMNSYCNYMCRGYPDEEKAVNADFLF